MKKIPTLFIRDEEDRRFVRGFVSPGCEWVLEGEGRATRKYDGTCMMLDAAGDWWARREVKPGKTAPTRFVAVDYDEVTGKTTGWEPVEQSSFAKFHAEALAVFSGGPGTYELLGPKINGNPEAFDAHVLWPHGWDLLSDREELADAPRDYDGLRDWLLDHHEWEGIVWHHDDGRMAKLKGRDFHGVAQ